MEIYFTPQLQKWITETVVDCPYFNHFQLRREKEEISKLTYSNVVIWDILYFYYYKLSFHTAVNIHLPVSYLFINNKSTPKIDESVNN